MARCLTPSVRVILLLSLASSLAVPLSAQRTTGRTQATGAPAPAQPIVRPVTPVTVPAPVTAAAPASAVVRQGVTARAPAFRPLSVESYALSRVDDNVNRDPVGVTSVGVVGGTTLRLTSAATRPLLVMEYDAAVHRYTATTRFNRVSQRVRATLTKRVVKWWTLDLVTEGARKGSSEDRDVSDQLMLLPHTEFRLGSARRLRVGVAQRWRRYPTDSLQDAVNQYVTGEYRHRLPDGAEFEAEVRMERNMARGDRFDFRRPSLSMTYGAAIGRAVHVEGGLQYRRQQYSGRFAKVNKVQVERVDHRLQPSAEITVRIGPSNLALSYEPEWRRSNDPDKVLSQHIWQLGLRRRWF